MPSVRGIAQDRPPSSLQNIGEHAVQQLPVEVGGSHDRLPHLGAALAVIRARLEYPGGAPEPALLAVEAEIVVEMGEHQWNKFGHDGSG